MIINPIKYPGNKSKVLSQLLPELNTSNIKIVDVFAGSGIVALNTSHEIKICNDISSSAIELLKYLYTKKVETVINNVEEIINSYGLTYSRIKERGYYKIEKNKGLSNHNREGYMLLRKDYNLDKDIKKLFVLMIYGFNHYIRFNKKGEFNVPVGKGDFSETIYNETVKFIQNIKNKNIHFLNYDFRDSRLYEYTDAVFYFDPPYLITSAPYNGQWNKDDEIDLLNLLDKLHEEGKRFVLSNVLLSNGKTNNYLVEWSKRFNVVKINRQYRNSNYRKKNLTDSQEIIVKNF